MSGVAGSDTVTATGTVGTPACPECSGPYLYSFTFRLTRGCTIGAAMDSTIAQDNDNIYYFGPFTRDSTPTELTLAAVLGWPGAPAGAGVQTQVRPLTASAVARRVLVVNGGSKWCPPDPLTPYGSDTVQLNSNGMPTTS